ncbi:MAG: hypothetical protein KAI43_14180 [Candidatus Aureabacteria bacterium]|nr:hypothetical protein [Candidatus Auribacterota bacterium]
MNETRMPNELTEKLTQFNYKIKSTNEGLIINLPFRCSVVITYREGNYNFTPKFGPLERNRAVWYFSIIYMLSLILFYVGSVSVPKFILLVGLVVMASTWDIFRFIITECCVLKVQNIIINMQKPSN